MRYVIDSSTAFKWLVVEKDSDKARRLRDEYRNGIHELLAPDFLTMELSNALIVAERRARITKGDTALARRLHHAPLAVRRVAGPPPARPCDRGGHGRQRL